MNERQKRLKEVYEHLRKFYGIHTQSDFANALRKSRNAITLALNGDEKYLTDKLFTTICEAYRGVFNLDYLLTGKETLLAKTEDQRQPVQATEPMPMWADNLIDIIAKQIKENEALNRELRQSITEFNAARADLEKIIYRLKSSSSEGTLAAES